MAAPVRRPALHPPRSESQPAAVSAPIQSAAVTMSFIGCTDLKQDDRTGGDQDGRTRRPPCRRPDGEPARMRTTPARRAASGVSRNNAFAPPTIIKGAISTDIPAAQIGEAASRRTGDGTKPAGRQRQRRVGPRRIGRQRAGGLQVTVRKRVGHQRVTGRVGSADGPRALEPRRTPRAPRAAAIATTLLIWRNGTGREPSPPARRRASQSSCLARGCAARSAPATHGSHGRPAAAWRRSPVRCRSDCISSSSDFATSAIITL